MSASITIKPQDSRCRYWAKIIRSGTPLPLPSDVDGANDVPGQYLRKGEDELMEGDFLLEGEEMHHRKARGWTYHLTFVGQDGEAVRVSPSAERKAAMKAGGLDPELLKGSGDVAAMIRMAHALRAGVSIGN